MSSPLALAADARIRLDHFGSEAQPILSVAGALADADAVVEIAARHSFRPIGAFYPGIRAQVSERIAMPLVEPLLGDLQSAFTLSALPSFRECYLSLVTHSPQDLAPIQRLPHFDGTEPTRLAVLLYLDRSERGGTAFYRQRDTGFESVDEMRYEPYRSALAQAVERHGLPEAGYIGGDTEIFERTHRVSDQYNSMVVYRGNTLHCADLPIDFVPDDDPASGRLTLNLFLD